MAMRVMLLAAFLAFTSRRRLLLRQRWLNNLNRRTFLIKAPRRCVRRSPVLVTDLCSLPILWYILHLRLVFSSWWLCFCLFERQMHDLLLLILLLIICVRTLQVEQFDFSGVGHLAKQPWNLLSSTFGLSCHGLAVHDLLVPPQQVTRMVLVYHLYDGVINHALGADSWTQPARTIDLPCRIKVKLDALASAFAPKYEINPLNEG